MIRKNSNPLSDPHRQIPTGPKIVLILLLFFLGSYCVQLILQFTNWAVALAFVVVYSLLPIFLYQMPGKLHWDTEWLIFILSMVVLEIVLILLRLDATNVVLALAFGRGIDYGDINLLNAIYILVFCFVTKAINLFVRKKTGNRKSS